ncbi:MAG TPA: hypothetical protein VIM01_02420, partial [Dermatophilaceae bacterium]
SGNADNPDGLRFTSRGGFPIRPGPTFTTPPVTRPTVSTPTDRPPPTTPYRGPSGDKLSLRWVTFDEPREPALV